MAPILRFITSSGYKKKEPRYVCRSEAKASPSHRMWTEVSSSVTPLKFTTYSGSKKKTPAIYVKIKTLKIPGNGAPLHVPPAGSLWREMFCVQSQWFIHSFIFIGVPKKEPSDEMRGKHVVTIQRAPHGQKAYIPWCVAWFPKGIVNDTAISTPVPCNLQHNTFKLGLDRPEPC